MAVEGPFQFVGKYAEEQPSRDFSQWQQCYQPGTILDTAWRAQVAQSSRGLYPQPSVPSPKH